MRVLAIFVAWMAIVTPASGETVTVDWGQLRLNVSDSRTAQVFHIVDQLSEWDQFAHKQYGRWARRSLPFDEIDRDFLRRHAELRRARGWGNGFEQAFYVDDTIEAAARHAVTAGLLTEGEAGVERQILEHFSPKLQPLIDEKSNSITTFMARLRDQAERVRPLIDKICRFAEVKTVEAVPVFLVANPEEGNGGGGANGGRIVVEVQREPDAVPFVIHESLHTLLDSRRQEVTRAAESAGLTWETFNEGIAYALAPGLTDDLSTIDTLAEAWARKMVNGSQATDTFVRFYMVATVIRPPLRAALESGETLTSFLPKAAAKWRQVAGR